VCVCGGGGEGGGGERVLIVHHAHNPKSHNVKNDKYKGNVEERKERKVMSKQNSILERQEEDDITSKCDVCVCVCVCD
jgi:hypothetical protein